MGEGCFGESKCVPVTPILFDFLANGSAGLLALGQPAAWIFTTGPDFYSPINQNLSYFCDCDWPRATAPVVFMLKNKDTQTLAALKKKLRSGLMTDVISAPILYSSQKLYYGVKAAAWETILTKFQNWYYLLYKHLVLTSNQNLMRTSDLQPILKTYCHLGS